MFFLVRAIPKLEQDSGAEAEIQQRFACCYRDSPLCSKGRASSLEQAMPALVWYGLLQPVLRQAFRCQIRRTFNSVS